MDQYYIIVTYILAGLLGLCVGSFLNVVIYRVPNNMNLAKPASHCPKCGYVLRWYDNIPILSYLMLGGKCRSCKEHISIRYTLVEILNMLLWLLSVYLFWEESIVYSVIAMLASTLLVCVFFIDLEHMLIFNRFSISIAVLGIVAMFFDDYTEIIDHILGGVIGGGIFVLLYYGAIWVLKKEGFGWGDVKLVAAAGLLLGWQKLLFAMLVASITGSIVLLAIRSIKKDEEGKEYPFAPFIVAGIMISMFVGAEVIQWYTNLLLG